MKLWELTDPEAKVISHLHENRKDPVRALIETSLRFDMEVGEVVDLYKKYSKK